MREGCLAQLAAAALGKDIVELDAPSSYRLMRLHAGEARVV